MLFLAVALSGCGGGNNPPGDTGGNNDSTEVTGLMAAAGYMEVELSWTPPTDANFEGVEITAIPVITAVTVPKGTNIKTITGLTNGTSYTFTVKWVNTNSIKKSTGVTIKATPATAFTVTYNENNNTGGSVPVDNTPHNWNTTVTVMENNTGASALIRIPAPAGTAEAFKFGGWNTQADGNGTTYAAGTGTFTITKNTMLYAKWVKFELSDIGPAGGLIFYDKGSFTDGWRYLESAPSQSEVSSAWGLMTVEIKTTGTGIGTGKSNTEEIVKKTSGAADYCSNLSVTNGGITYSDWFLPSQDELNAMFVNMVQPQPTVGDFHLSGYWSSSERAIGHAWSQWFSNGEKTIFQKSNSYYVRAARAF